MEEEQVTGYPQSAAEGGRSAAGVAGESAQPEVAAGDGGVGAAGAGGSGGSDRRAAGGLRRRRWKER